MTLPTTPQERKIIHAHRSAFRSIESIDADALAHIDMSEPLHYTDGTEPPQPIATRVGMEWNDLGLLVYFRGRFEHLRLMPADTSDPGGAKTHRLWERSDVFEVFVGKEAARTGLYKEFQVAPDGRWLDIEVHRPLGISNHYWHSGFRCRSFIDHEMQIWSAVIELPWNCFGLNNKTSDEWNINFYRASGKFHGDELLAWSPPGTGERCFHRYQFFGTIDFLQ